MKKTRQSLLTAALFAAAVSTSAGGTILPQLASAEGDVTTVPQTSYGPPVCITEPDTTTATTVLMPEGTVPIDTGTSTTCCDLPEYDGVFPVPTETEEPLMMMGDPVVYDEPGDLNMDGSIDVRDLTLLKQYLLQNTKRRYPDRTLDADRDGELSKEDVRALVRLLTGKPEDEDDPAVTSEALPEPASTTTTELTTVITTLYGPPPAWY